MKPRKQAEIMLNDGGWHFHRRNKGHDIWRCGCGKHQMSVSISPSDVRFLKNVKTTMRACQEG